MANFANENNCFQHFNFNANNRNNFNQYLLAQLSRLMFPDRLAKDLGLNTIVSDASFQTQFANRTRHWFSNPQFSYITNTNPISRIIDDPELMIISTSKFIIIVVRGTDPQRNNSGRPLNDSPIFNVFEWIGTNAMAVLTPVNNRNGVNGRVHFGFFRSLSSIDRRVSAEILRLGGMNKKIWITGHSLGAGQATILASIIINHDKIPVQGLYVFGSPSSVGDSNFANQLNANFNSTRSKRFHRFEVRYI